MRPIGVQLCKVCKLATLLPSRVSMSVCLVSVLRAALSQADQTWVAMDSWRLVWRTESWELRKLLIYLFSENRNRDEIKRQKNLPKQTNAMQSAKYMERNKKAIIREKIDLREWGKEQLREGEGLRELRRKLWREVQRQEKEGFAEKDRARERKNYKLWNIKTDSSIRSHRRSKSFIYCFLGLDVMCLHCI